MNTIYDDVDPDNTLLKRVNEAAERRNWHHISDHPDLRPDTGYEPRQGQLGRGFYVTSEPKVWSATLGKRKFTYKVVNPRDFNICTNPPSNKEFLEWAVDHGYMEPRVVKRPNGEVVYDMKELGFDGYEAVYSRDGHQIILFDPTKVHLRRLAR